MDTAPLHASPAVRPQGWSGVVADWSSDQRSFKGASWGKVMMAIRMSGRCTPPISSAKTSLGFGHGTVEDIRTVM